jgi:hypothetical protein
MCEDSVGIEDILREELEVCKELQLTLKNIIDHQQGTVWPVEQVDKINGYIVSLMKLDEKLMVVSKDRFNLKQKTEVLDLLNNMEKAMLEIKQFLFIFQTRLIGGKEMISCEIKNIIRGMRIRDYQSRPKVDTCPTVCLC